MQTQTSFVNTQRTTTKRCSLNLETMPNDDVETTQQENTSPTGANPLF